jgi:hypothetical protein
VKAALSLWSLASRFALLAITVMLCLYFVVSTVVTGPLLFSILNEALLGRFGAEYVVIDFVKFRVTAFGVRIQHPSGQDVITVGRAETSIDFLAMAAWGVRAAVGVSAPLPVGLRDLVGEDYRVVIPFDQNNDIIFHDTFMPAVVTPDEGPSGPPPEITLSHIQMGQGKVELTFRDWRMDIGVEGLLCDIRIKGGDSMLLVARDLHGGSFTITGLVPEPVTFAVEKSSRWEVADFRLTLEGLEALGGRAVHPDMDVRIERFKFRWADESMPVDGTAWVDLHSAERMDHITMGHAFGEGSLWFHMFGSIVRPNFEFKARADRIVAEGLDLENAQAHVLLDIRKGVELSIPTAEADLDGGHVSVRNGGISVREVGIPEIRFDACMDGLRPAMVLEALGLEGFLDYRDVLASGCFSKARIGRGEMQEIEVQGKLAVALDLGASLEERLGPAAGSVEGTLFWDPTWLVWDGLELATDIGSAVSARGTVTLGPDPSWQFHAALTLEPMEAVPLIAGQGLEGRLLADRIRFAGRLERPHVQLSAWLTNFGVGGERFDDVEIEAVLDDWKIDASTFCFVQGPNHGCLAFQAELSGPEGFHLTSIPLSLKVVEPLEVDLARIPFLTPFLSIPLEGKLTLASANLVGTVVPDFTRTLASLVGEATAEVEDLDFGDLSADRIVWTLKKPALPTEGQRVGAIEAAVQWNRLHLPPLKMAAGKLELAIDDLPSLTLAGGMLPFAAGKGKIALDGVEYGTNRINRLTFNFQGLKQEGQPDRLTFKGRLTPVTKKEYLSFSGDWVPARRVASLKAESAMLALASLPPDLLGPELRELFAQTVFAGTLSLKTIPIDPLLANDGKALFAGLAGSGRFTATHLERLDEPVSSVSADVTLSRGKLTLAPLDVQFENGTKVRAEGTWHPLSDRMDLDVSLSNTRLSTLRTFRRAEVPLDAVVWGKLKVHGELSSAQVEGQLSASDFVVAGIKLGECKIDAQGALNDTVEIRSPRFFDGFSLRRGALRFDRGRPTRLELDMSFAGLNLARIVPDLPAWIVVKGEGTGELGVSFVSGQAPFSLAVSMLEERLSVCTRFEGEEVSCLTNLRPAALTVDAEGVHFEDVAVAGEGQRFRAKGLLDFVRGWDITVWTTIDVAQVKWLSELFATYSGKVGSAKEGVRLVGPMASPRVEGKARIRDLLLAPRQLGTEIAVKEAFATVQGSVFEGDVLLVLEEDLPLAGTYDEGEFSIFGWLKLAGWDLEAALLDFAGREIFYQSPGQFRLVLSPRVEIKLADLTDPEAAGGRISGDVFVSEGEFTRNFDKLLGSFATAFSRSQERYSKPLTETLPFLKNVAMDLRVQGGNFAVSSRFPFGETELTVELDLKVGGTIGEPQVWEWMHVVPDGTITYKLVKRVFRMIRGAVEFSGDPTAPYLDLEAMTEVPYNSAALETAGTTSAEEDMWGTTVDITIRLRGVYPNLKPEFSTNRPGFDDADLQSLILLGMTRKDIEGKSGGQGNAVSINLLTEDIAGMVKNLILAPFVDSVSLGITQEGGILAEAATKIGRAINLSARVRQDASGSEYSARLQFRITDRLSLEGRMKTVEDEAETHRGYEAKFRYIIPLE